MKVLDPFKHNFYTYDLDVTDTEINQVKNFLQDVKPTEDMSYSLSSYSAINILNLPLLKNLRKQVTDILDEKNLILDNNWGQMYKTGHEHPIHTHAGSDYSGIIYLTKTYDDSSSGTWFYDYYTQHYQFPFTEKTLLLFPSYFPHYVKAVFKDGYRIVISFNSIYKKT